MCDRKTSSLFAEQVVGRYPDVVKHDLGMPTQRRVRIAKTVVDRRSCTPGVSRGIRIIECRRCRSASGSVTPITTSNLHRSRKAPLAHHFRPLMTYSSPSRLIRVSRLLGSELATAGSVMVKVDRIVPSKSGTSHWSHCSGEPNSASSSMFPVSGAEQFVASGASSLLQPVISANGAYCKFVRPAPQRVSGRNRFHSLGDPFERLLHRRFEGERECPAAVT